MIKLDNLDCLCLLLVWLKCMGHFDHSWWLVTAPIWAPIWLGAVLSVCKAGKK